MDHFYNVLSVKYVYIDESGNTSIATDKAGATPLYVPAAVVLDEKDIHAYFATMVPVCQTLFSNGEPENGNLAQKEYFNKFLELFKNKKAFSWNKESDVEWAIQYDYYDYLQMIWDNYID